MQNCQKANKIAKKNTAFLRKTRHFYEKHGNCQKTRKTRLPCFRDFLLSLRIIDLFSAAGCEKKLFPFILICVMLITSDFDCSKRQLEAVFIFCKISAIVCYILLIVIAQKINFD